MKGYIYTMYQGADPATGWHMNDPHLGRRPTFGACMPNIRRFVQPEDYIFVISGRVKHLQQYVVGGFQVDRKLHSLAALHEVPEQKLARRADGQLAGNIIVEADGSQSALDYHNNFEARIENYILGKNPIVLDRDIEVERARAETVEALAQIFYKPNSNTVKDVIGRWRKLDSTQVEQLLAWLRNIKSIRA